jgi:hypothetical protein
MHSPTNHRFKSTTNTAVAQHLLQQGGRLIKPFSSRTRLCGKMEIWINCICEKNAFIIPSTHFIKICLEKLVMLPQNSDINSEFINLNVPIHVRVWLASPAGLGFQWVKLVRVWSGIHSCVCGEIYPSLAPESSSPRRTREPDSYVYGHLRNSFFKFSPESPNSCQYRHWLHRLHYRNLIPRSRDYLFPNRL